jgi:signal peptidase I
MARAAPYAGAAGLGLGRQVASNRDAGRAKAKKKKKPKRQESWLETIKTVLWAVAIALLVRTFAYEPFSIPSGSMLPGLLVGDYLFVSKFSYGYSRYSFPYGSRESFLNPFRFSGRVLPAQPKRGDVVVFRLPSDTKVDYIKRVIGLPGDTVQVRDGRLHLNGKVVERRRVSQAVVRDTEGEGGRYGEEVLYTVYTETLPGGPSYRIYEQSDSYPGADNTPVYKVPENHYFMMGDNRDNSCDSRFSTSYNPVGAGPRCLQLVGFVPHDNLIGRAEFIFFSSDRTAEIWEVWKWPFSIRFGRFLQGVR